MKPMQQEAVHYNSPKPPRKIDDLVTAGEIAQLLGIARNSVYRLTYRKVLRRVSVGGSNYRYSISETLKRMSQYNRGLLSGLSHSSMEKQRTGQGTGITGRKYAAPSLNPS